MLGKNIGAEDPNSIRYLVKTRSNKLCHGFSEAELLIHNRNSLVQQSWIGFESPFSEETQLESHSQGIYNRQVF